MLILQILAYHLTAAEEDIKALQVISFFFLYPFFQSRIYMLTDVIFTKEKLHLTKTLPSGH